MELVIWTVAVAGVLGLFILLCYREGKRKEAIAALPDYEDFVDAEFCKCERCDAA